MKMFRNLKAWAVCFLLCGVFFSLRAAGGDSPFKDGTDEGEHSFVAVEVSITNGRIVDIRMTHHGGGGEKYAEMVKPLITRILEKQSTDVDAVTGATVSSNHLKKAVKNALQKATI